MARISNYAQDSTVTGDDKLLGTDSATGQTKNFTLSSFRYVSIWNYKCAWGR